MLQRIRDNASGPFAYVVVGLISLVFGVWGIGSYLTPSANPVVATVGNVNITTYQLRQAYNQHYRRLQAMLGNSFDPSTIKPAQMRRSILQQLIRSAVLEEYARNAGYRTTDAALLNRLKADPRFQVNGKFSTKLYRSRLANAGLQASAFETRLRHNMVSGQLRQGLVGSSFTVPPGVEHAYNLRHQKRKVAYLVFPAAAYTDQVKINSDEIHKWYRDHGDMYQRPERVKLSYVELDRSDMKVPEKVTSASALQSLYKEHKGQFSTPDKRTAKQLFLPVGKDNAAAARKQIQSVAGQLAKGKSFADVIAAAGDDSNLKIKQLDSVSRKDVPADVAKALFSLPIGQLSSPIRTDNGWVLVKPTAKQPGKTQSFDEPAVQKKLKTMARTQWRSRNFSDLSEKMQTLAFQAPNSLKTLSSKLDLKVQTTGWINRDGGDGLGQYKAVRKAAFSSDVLNEKLNSKAIRIGKGRLVVVRVAKHQSPQEIPLDQVKDRIKTDLTAHKAQQLAHEAAVAARGKLAKGAAPAEVAKATSATLKQPGYIERTNSKVPDQVRAAAFSVSEPAKGKTSYKVTQTASDNAVLVAVSGVKKAGNKGGGDVAPKFAQAERGYIARNEYAAFVGYLDAHADVNINKEKLAAQ